jgi:5-formyltetrahydrofolate cyclo-ligase
MNKKEMRAAMQALMRGVPKEDLAARSRLVAERLADTAAWKRANTILCFLSMPHELSTQPIIEMARRQGKAIAVPRIEENDISFHVMPPNTGTLPRDRWDIPVPDPSWVPIDIGAAGAILVANPGLAFDRTGNRLGRGKGYYDRFLAKIRGAVRDITVIGVCLSEQVLPLVPHEEHDQRLDGLVTEKDTLVIGTARP